MKSLFKKCDKDNDWELIKDKKSSGKYGKIYNICCGKKCNYIIKLQADTKKNERELLIHKHIQSLSPKLVPKIYDVIDYEDEKGIIMEKMDYTLSDVISMINKDKDSSEEQKINARIKITKDIKDMIRNLHLYCGVVHKDLHPLNIMCKKNKDYEKDDYSLDEMFESWKIIDFGESKYIEEYENKIDLVFDTTSDYDIINNVI